MKKYLASLTMSLNHLGDHFKIQVKLQIPLNQHSLLELSSGPLNTGLTRENWWESWLKSDLFLGLMVEDWWSIMIEWKYSPTIHQNLQFLGVTPKIDMIDKHLKKQC